MLPIHQTEKHSLKHNFAPYCCMSVCFKASVEAPVITLHLSPTCFLPIKTPSGNHKLSRVLKLKVFFPPAEFSQSKAFRQMVRLVWFSATVTFFHTRCVFFYIPVFRLITVNSRLLHWRPTSSRISHSWLKHLNKICMPVSSAWGTEPSVNKRVHQRCFDFLGTAATEIWKHKSAFKVNSAERTEQLQPRKFLYIVDPCSRHTEGNATLQATLRI